MLEQDGHVRHDLHWLLTAAIEFTNHYDSGALTVILQDSALMHGRALIEFACTRQPPPYISLCDFLESRLVIPSTVSWKKWLDFMGSQTAHLSHQRDPGAAWPYNMGYDSRDRMQRLARDVVSVLETAVPIARRDVAAALEGLATWAREHLTAGTPPSAIL